MTKDRRKKIERAVELLSEGLEYINEVLEEETDAFGNMPESIQASERGGKMDEAIGYLGDAQTDVENAISALESIE